MMPRPVQVQRHPAAGNVRLSTRSAVHAAAGTEPSARVLHRGLTRMVGAPGPTGDADAAGPARDAEVVLDLARSAEPDALAGIPAGWFGLEGYILEVDPPRVCVASVHPAGIARGVQTLLALAAMHDDGHAGAVLPALSIRDRPRFAHRGLLLDVARHFHPRATVERVIAVLALLRCNVLHLHLTDDQGWRLPVPGYPELTRIGAWRTETRGDGRAHGGAFTDADLDAILALAAEHHLDVIPEVDVPGHLGAAIAAYPWLSCAQTAVPVRTRFGINPVIACAGRDRSVRFLEDVVDTVCTRFPAPLIHLGGDEVPRGAWLDCLDCQTRCTALGIERLEQLQAWLLDRLVARARQHGRRVAVYNDGIAAGCTDPEVVMHYWLEGGGAPRARAEAAAGRPVILSPFFHTYLDYPHAMTPLRKVLRFDPEQHGLGATPSLLGVEAALWTEYVPDEATLWRQLLPRLPAIAEAGWSEPLLREPADARDRLTDLMTVLTRLGVTGTPIDHADATVTRRFRHLARFGAEVVDRQLIGSLVHRIRDERRVRRAGW